jgi:hypothetical protein
MPGRAYKAAQGTEITVHILAVGGEMKKIPIAEKISIVARRHYTAVMFSLPEKLLRNLGHDSSKGSATISISALASAIPLQIATDKAPLSAFEIKKYTGPLRQIARGVFDRESVKVKITRHLNQVINRLPDDFANDEAQFEKSWAKVTKNKSRNLTPEVMGAASNIAQRCREEFTVGRHTTMRSCLEQFHDVLAAETNKKIWQAMKPGG